MLEDSKMSNEGSQVQQANTQWSHVAETINMLYLAVCQIETTMADSNSSMNTLTRSFTQLAEHTNGVSRQAHELTQTEELKSFKQDLAATAAEMDLNINASIKAFQFYDRACQRLDHVSKSLEKVTQVIGDTHRREDPMAWQQIQEDIKASYTMEAERVMFEYIMRGGSVQQALEIYRHHFNNLSESDGSSDEIELF